MFICIFWARRESILSDHFGVLLFLFSFSPQGSGVQYAKLIFVLVGLCLAQVSPFHRYTISVMWHIKIQHSPTKTFHFISQCLSAVGS